MSIKRSPGNIRHRLLVIDKSFSMTTILMMMKKLRHSSVLICKKYPSTLGIINMSERTKYHDFNGSTYNRSRFLYFRSETIKTLCRWKYYCSIAPHRYFSGLTRTGVNNHCFAFVITDEDIDLTKHTPTKEATLKALQDGISLTVVGKTYKSIKKTSIHWSMEQMVFT